MENLVLANLETTSPDFLDVKEQEHSRADVVEMDIGIEKTMFKF